MHRLLCSLYVTFSKPKPVISDVLPLLERSLSRARDEQISALLSILNEAISVIHPERQATVPESLKLFQEKTFRAMKDYIAQVHQATLSVIKDTNVSFTSDDKSAVLALVEKYVEPSLYLTRFAAYEGAVARHVARFGSPFQLSDFRPDLTKAIYNVGSINTIRSFLATLSDDLEVIAQKQRNSSTPSVQEGKLDQANRLIKLEPNFFGIGVNLNYLIRRLLGRRE